MNYRLTSDDMKSRKKLAEETGKYLDRRDELIAKRGKTEEEVEELRNLTNLIQKNTSAMLKGGNKSSNGPKILLMSPNQLPNL